MTIDIHRHRREGVIGREVESPLGALVIPAAAATARQIMQLLRGQPCGLTDFEKLAFQSWNNVASGCSSDDELARLAMLAVIAGYEVSAEEAIPCVTPQNAHQLAAAAWGVGHRSSKLQRRAWALCVAADPAGAPLSPAEFEQLASWVWSSGKAPQLPPV